MTKSKKQLTLEELKVAMDRQFSKMEERFDKLDTTSEATSERVTLLRKDMTAGFNLIDTNFDELHSAIQNFVGDAVIPLDKRVTKLEHKIFPAQI